MDQPSGSAAGGRGLCSEKPREAHPARTAPRTISSAVFFPSP